MSRRESSRRDPAHPQGAFARLASWSIARGFVRPTRDLDLYHESLIARGVACRFGDDLEIGDVPPLDEVDEVADRVRRLMGVRDRPGGGPPPHSFAVARRGEGEKI